MRFQMSDFLSALQELVEAEQVEFIKPVTPACIMSVADKHRIPVAFLGAIWHVENGRAGTISFAKASNTYDVGPMQINSRNFEFLYDKYGFTPSELVWDGCKNMDAAATLIKSHFNSGRQSIESWSELLKVLARYHSKTERFNLTYRNKLEQYVETYLVEEYLVQ
jgi:hypothetical protein